LKDGPAAAPHRRDNDGATARPTSRCELSSRNPKGDAVERFLNGCPAFWNRLARVIVSAALVTGLQHGTVAAQQRLIVSGTVQWTASTRLQVMSDAGVSVSVDLSRVGQGSFPLLRAGNRVVVVGFVAPDGSRLIAESVEPGQPGGGYWNLFPEAP
jgi:hypothetical protein